MKPKLILVFSFFCLLFTKSSSQNADINILRDINLNRNKNLDGTMRFISNTVAPIGFAVPVGLMATGWIQNDKALSKKGYVAGASLLLAVALTTTLKYSINRQRPFDTFSDVDKQADGGGPSFPSGHTTVAFATAASLSFAYPKWYVIVPSFAWAGSVAFSRMHLGVHYPSDILGGIVIGVGSSFLCYKAQQWIK